MPLVAGGAWFVVGGVLHVFLYHPFSSIHYFRVAAWGVFPFALTLLVVATLGIGRILSPM